jgi:hypothetical protein
MEEQGSPGESQCQMALENGRAQTCWAFEIDVNPALLIEVISYRQDWSVGIPAC